MVPRLIRPYGWVSLFYLFYWEDVVYIIINIILLVGGFIVLIKGADMFVDGASNVA